MGVKEAFRSLFARPQPIPTSAVKYGVHLSEEEKKVLKTLGVYVNNLSSLISWANTINQDRLSVSRDIERSLQHPMISQALKLYTSFATNFDRVNNATVWITSPNAKYRNLGEEFLDNLNVEGRVTDWVYSLAGFGNHFLGVKGLPGHGVISVDDSENQVNLSRVDSEGVLLGFYHTPLGNVSNVQKLLPPWSYVHMSMNGTKVRRPIYGEAQSTEFRSISLLSPDIRRLSSQYGTGVVNDAIPTYKRMRLTEDSIMLAALSKRILRYLIKVGVDGNNIEGIKEVLDQYASVLKRQKAINPNSNQMTDNLDYTDVVTDILLPVWGGVNNLELEKMGGDIDVKWIADLDDQRAMLATSLDVPLNMFGGFTQETPSGLNTSAAESISVTFARKSRMVQRGTIEGFRRLFQIHLAYLGMNPDLKLFDVCMSDTSTVEEAERVKVLKDTIDSLQSFTDFITNLLGERIDRVWLLDYLNQKFLKLNDFQINKLIKNQDPNNFVTVMKEKINKEQIKQLLVETKVNEEEKEKVLRFVDENYSNSYRKPKVCSMDVRAHLPLKESKAQWESLYGKTKVKEEIIKEEKK